MESDSDETSVKDTPMIMLASRGFVKVEVFAYLVLGVLLALTALLGIATAAIELWKGVQAHGDAVSLVSTIDKLLFVLMIIEIMHTVRVSFRSGVLVCEPFLIVGLIASIRRILVITLESSQISQPGKWTPEAQEILHATETELAVLGGLILVMVVSIYLLRRSDHARSDNRSITPG
jgi:phosphate starvation-inducible membrane PsiE